MKHKTERVEVTTIELTEAERRVLYGITQLRMSIATLFKENGYGEAHEAYNLLKALREATRRGIE